MSTTTRILWMADLHSGHFAGLTHPDFERKPKRNQTPAYQQWRTRRKCWDFFTKIIKQQGPFDIVVVMGDAIDGKGEKSGGTELLTADRVQQTDMAAAAILHVGASDIYAVYGTPYHAGVDEAWEDEVAHKANIIKIENVGRLNIHGKLFKYRHYVGRSSIPHGRFTPLARERLWNVLWSERKEDIQADYLIFAHVHYHICCGEPNTWMAYTCPALQAYGTRFGEQKMSGTVDFGLMWSETDRTGDTIFDSRTLKFPFSGQVIKA